MKSPFLMWISAMAKSRSAAPPPSTRAWRSGSCAPCDVKVQLYFGMLDSAGAIREGDAIDMRLESENGRRRLQLRG